MEKEATVAESWKPGSRYMNVSQLVTWLKCRWLWEKVYVKNVQVRFERPAISLGDCAHNLVAPFLRGESPESGLPEWEKQYENVALTEEEEEIKRLVLEAAWKIFERVRKELDLGHRFRVAKKKGEKLVEFHFQVDQPAGNYLGFQGYVDAVLVELSNGRQWLTDWKFRKSFQPVDAEEFSMQMAIYTKMLRVSGLKPVGSMVWQFKSSPPRKPKENQPKKDGTRTLSRQQILTDWETYSEAVLEIGGNPDDYADMKVKLDEVEWHRQNRAYWDDYTINGFWKEAIKATSQIGKGKFTRAISYLNCKPCRLRDLCQADLRGADVDFLMKTQYALRGEKTRALPVLLDDDEEVDVQDLKGQGET